MPVKVIARDLETRQPTAIRCSCGARVELDGGDVDCQCCGQPFNAFGQKLRRVGAHDQDCPGCHECC